MTVLRKNREELKQYYFVIKQLVDREIKRKYARSFLGVIWSVLNPLMTMAVMSMIFSTIFKRTIENYPIYYLTGTIFFAVVDKLVKQLRKQDSAEALILSMRGVPMIDLSGIEAMIDLVRELEANGTEVYLTSVQPKVLEEMRRGGLIDLIGEEYVFQSAEQAIVIAQQEHM